MTASEPARSTDVASDDLIERAIARWSKEPQRDVMLPGLGVKTCGEFADALLARIYRAPITEAVAVTEPAYWIVTWPGKSQGVHAAYAEIEEAKHAAKNIANYSTRKTETTIVPLYTLPQGEVDACTECDKPENVFSPPCPICLARIREIQRRDMAAEPTDGKRKL